MTHAVSSVYVANKSDYNSCDQMRWNKMLQESMKKYLMSFYIMLTVK